MYDLNVYLCCTHSTHTTIIPKYFCQPFAMKWKYRLIFSPHSPGRVLLLSISHDVLYLWVLYMLCNLELKSFLQMILFPLDYAQNRFHSSSIVAAVAFAVFMWFLHGNDDLYSIYFPLRYFFPLLLLLCWNHSFRAANVFFSVPVRSLIDVLVYLRFKIIFCDSVCLFHKNFHFVLLHFFCRLSSLLLLLLLADICTLVSALPFFVRSHVWHNTYVIFIVHPSFRETGRMCTQQCGLHVRII